MTHTRTHEEVIYTNLQSLQSLQASDNAPDLRFFMRLRQRLNSRWVALLQSLPLKRSSDRATEATEPPALGPRNRLLQADQLLGAGPSTHLEAVPRLRGL